MSNLYKYQIYCETESSWVSKWDEIEISVCPNNNGHTVTSGSVSVIDMKLDVGPTMADGRPIVRADTRPIGTQTYFTCTGDTVSGIGDGQHLCWNFADEENIYDPNVLENPQTIASGFKAKKLDVWFNENVYLKDGVLYYQNATYGTNVSAYLTVPSGNYYPNNVGDIPASALGLPGTQMYAYATKDVLFACYIRNHHMLGDCTVGDELDAEGSQIEPLPSGWYITGIIVVPEDNNTFVGHASLEMYREHSIILPGGGFGGE